MKIVLLILLNVQFSWMTKNDMSETFRRDAELTGEKQLNQNIENPLSYGENMKNHLQPETLRGMKKREIDATTKEKGNTKKKEGKGKKRSKNSKTGKEKKENKENLAKNKSKKIRKYKAEKRKLENKEKKVLNKRQKKNRENSLKKSNKKKKRNKGQMKKKLLKKGKKGLKMNRSRTNGKANKNKRKKSKSKKGVKERKNILKQTQQTCSCNTDKRILVLNNKLKQARLITNTFRSLESKKSKATTTFEDAAVAIKIATDNGKRCNGKPISQYPAASTAFSVLQTCNSTAAAKCDVTKVLQITNETFFKKCIEEFSLFTQGYQSCVRNACNCSCYTKLPNVSKDCEKFDFSKVLKSVVVIRKNCLNPSDNGSFSNCRLQQREVAKYGEECKTCVPTPITTGSVTSQITTSRSTKGPPVTSYEKPIPMKNCTKLEDLERQLKYVIELVMNQTQKCCQSCSVSTTSTVSTSKTTYTSSNISTFTPTNSTNYTTMTTGTTKFECPEIIIEAELRDENGEPLPLVPATIKKDGQIEYNVTFDRKGKLEQTLGSGGNYTLDVSLTGYKNLPFNFSVNATNPADCKTDYNLTLISDFKCEEIIIEATLRNQDDDPLANVPATIKKDDGSIEYSVTFDRKGKLKQTLRSGGRYTIQISKTEYEDFSSTFEIDERDPDQCKTEYTLVMTKVLIDRETRMCMSWFQNNTGDMDLYVMSVSKVDNSTCLTSLDNKRGCNNIEQDRDNDKGGKDGPEIVTFLDRTVNSNFTYIVAVEEYFGAGTERDNGTNLLNSGVQIEIKGNNNYTETYKLNSPNKNVTEPNTFYLFGCLQINENSQPPYFTFKEAEDGTFFNGSNGNVTEWLQMYGTHC